MMMRTRSRTLAILATAALFAAACGDDVTDEPAADDVATEDEATDEATDDAGEATEDAEDDATEGDDVDLAIADSPLGDHLVDAEGITLYLFDNDEPGVSNCTDDCLDSWPPLTVDDEPTWGEGVDGDLVGTIEREDDGSTQVTYDDMPLYFWAGDSAPGDVEGQGVNDVWWVVAPDGSAIQDSADAAADASDDDGGGRY
jgi:predicted lipoprotein with Yx(FWY)xxD motif